MFVLLCLAEQEAAAHTRDAVAVVHISCSTSVTAVCFISGQVALVAAHSGAVTQLSVAGAEPTWCSKTLTLVSPVLQARWEKSPSVAQTLSFH